MSSPQDNYNDNDDGEGHQPPETPAATTNSWFGSITSRVFGRTPSTAPVGSRVGSTVNSTGRVRRNHGTPIPRMRDLHMNMSSADGRGANDNSVAKDPDSNTPAATTFDNYCSPSSRASSAAAAGGSLAAASPWRSQAMNGTITVSGYEKRGSGQATGAATSRTPQEQARQLNVGFQTGTSSGTPGSSSVRRLSSGRSSRSRRRRMASGSLFSPVAPQVPSALFSENSGQLRQLSEQVLRSAAMPAFQPPRQIDSGPVHFGYIGGRTLTGSGIYPNRLLPASRVRPRDEEDAGAAGGQLLLEDSRPRKQRKVCFREDAGAGEVADRTDGVRREWIGAKRRATPARPATGQDAQSPASEQSTRGLSASPSLTTVSSMHSVLEPEPTLARPSSRGPFSLGVSADDVGSVDGEFAPSRVSLVEHLVTLSSRSTTRGPEPSPDPALMTQEQILEDGKDPKKKQKKTPPENITGFPRTPASQKVQKDEKKESDEKKEEPKGTTSGWGSLFPNLNKGKWQCKVCLAHNDNSLQKCLACENPRDDACRDAAPSVDNTDKKVKPAKDDAKPAAASLNGGGSIGASGFTFPGSASDSAAATAPAAPSATGGATGGFTFGDATAAGAPAAAPFVFKTSGPSITGEQKEETGAASGFSFQPSSSAQSKSNGIATKAPGTSPGTDGQKKPAFSFNTEKTGNSKNESATITATSGPKFQFGVSNASSAPSAGKDLGTAPRASTGTTGFDFTNSTFGGSADKSAGEDGQRKKRSRTKQSASGSSKSMTPPTAPGAPSASSSSSAGMFSGTVAPGSGAAPATTPFVFGPSKTQATPAAETSATAPATTATPVAISAPAVDNSATSGTGASQPAAFSFGTQPPAAAPTSATSAAPGFSFATSTSTASGASAPAQTMNAAPAPFGDPPTAKAASADSGSSTFVFGAGSNSQPPSTAATQFGAGNTTAAPATQPGSGGFGGAGATVSAATQPVAPTFGSSTTTVPASASASSFGVSKTSGLSQPAGASAPGFGAGSTSAPSLSAGTASQPFGAGNAPAPGQPAPATSGFGTGNATAPAAPAPGFGTSMAANPFGSAPATGGTSGFVFGSTGSSSTPQAPTAPGFAPATAPPAPAFGSTGSQGFAFGNNGSNAPGAPPANAGGFNGFGAAAQPPPAGSAPMAFGTSAPGAPPFQQQQPQSGGFGAPAAPHPQGMAGGGFQMGTPTPRPGRRYVRAKRPSRASGNRPA